MKSVFKVTDFDEKGEPIRTIIEHKRILWSFHYYVNKYFNDEHYACIFDDESLTVYVYELNKEHYKTKLSISNLMEED